MLNLLIQHWFDIGPHKYVKFFFALQHKPRELRIKISLANFLIRATLTTGRSSSGLTRRAKMAWKAPKIVEVPVGMEINMYACAARK